MKAVETDYGTVPVTDESYELLRKGGLLHKDLLKELDETFKFMPVFSSISAVRGRIGLWSDGEAHWFIRMVFGADYAAPTDCKVQMEEE